MAAINRFTNIDQSQNAYTPRSFEELLKPAAYMRGKHDELLAQKTLYDTEIAKLDSLDVHNEQYMAARQKLEEGLGGITDQLNNEGFSQSAKSNFINFNKDYQNAIGPKGELGQIKGAQEAYITNRAEHLKSAQAAGQSMESAISAFDDHYANYKESKGVDELGNIVNIGQIGAPQYIDSIELMQERLKQLGHEGKMIKDLAGTSVTQLPNGQIAIRTTSSNQKVIDNVKNIESAMNSTIMDLKDANSSLSKSNSYNKREIEQEIKRLEEYAGVARIKDVTTNTQESLRPFGSTAGKTGTDKKDFGNSLSSVKEKFSELTDHEGETVESAEQARNALDAMDSKIEAFELAAGNGEAISQEDREIIQSYKQKKKQLLKYKPIREIYERQNEIAENRQEVQGRISNFQFGDLFVPNSDVSEVIEANGAAGLEGIYQGAFGSGMTLPEDPYQKAAWKKFQGLVGPYDGQYKAIDGVRELAHKKDANKAYVIGAKSYLEQYVKRQTNATNKAVKDAERALAAHPKAQYGTEERQPFIDALAAAKAKETELDAQWRDFQWNEQGNDFWAAEKLVEFNAPGYDTAEDKMGVANYLVANSMLGEIEKNVKDTYIDVLNNRMQSVENATAELDRKAFQDMEVLSRTYSIWTTQTKGVGGKKILLDNVRTQLSAQLKASTDAFNFVGFQDDGKEKRYGSNINQNVSANEQGNIFSTQAADILGEMLENWDDSTVDLQVTPVGESGVMEYTVVNGDQSVSISVPETTDINGTSTVEGNIMNTFLDMASQGDEEAVAEAQNIADQMYSAYWGAKFASSDKRDYKFSDNILNTTVMAKARRAQLGSGSKEDRAALNFYQRHVAKYLAKEHGMTPYEFHNKVDDATKETILKDFNNNYKL